MHTARDLWGKNCMYKMYTYNVRLRDVVDGHSSPSVCEYNKIIRHPPRPAPRENLVLRL